VEEAALDAVAARLLAAGVFVAVPKYVGGEVTAPPPALRLAVQVDHEERQLVAAADAIGAALAGMEGGEPLLGGV